LSTTELIKVRDVLARALSGDDVNQLGRDTGGTASAIHGDDKVEAGCKGICLDMKSLHVKI